MVIKNSSHSFNISCRGSHKEKKIDTLCAMARKAERASLIEVYGFILSLLHFGSICEGYTDPRQDYPKSTLLLHFGTRA